MSSSAYWAVSSTTALNQTSCSISRQLKATAAGKAPRSLLKFPACSFRMREWPEFADVTCLAIACPSCMTLDLARSCASYVTTIINGADLIPTVSAGQPPVDHQVALWLSSDCFACLLQSVTGSNTACTSMWPCKQPDAMLHCNLTTSPVTQLTQSFDMQLCSGC